MTLDNIRIHPVNNGFCITVTDNSRTEKFVARNSKEVVELVREILGVKFPPKKGPKLLCDLDIGQGGFIARSAIQKNVYGDAIAVNSVCPLQSEPSEYANLWALKVSSDTYWVDGYDHPLPGKWF